MKIFSENVKPKRVKTRKKEIKRDKKRYFKIKLFFLKNLLKTY